MAARLVRDEEVAGSNPAIPTRCHKGKSLTKRSVLAAGILLLFGQLFLISVAPMTRAAGTFTQVVGVAILAPDSVLYLPPEGSNGLVLDAPWTRWTYPVLILLSDRIGDQYLGVIIMQSAALWLAGALLFAEMQRTVSLRAAWFAAAILLLNPMTAQWSRIIMSEAIFFAAIATVLALLRRWLDDRSPWRASLAVLIAIGVLFLRPNGFLVLASALTVLLMVVLAGRRSRRLSVTAVWLAAAILLPIASAATGPPAEGSFTSQIYDGVVVEGAAHVRTVIRMPAPADPQDESYAAAVQYAASNPVAIARLGAARLIAETAQVRRHYPALINGLMGGAMAIFLIALLLGSLSRRSEGWRLVGATLALPLMFMTTITFAVAEGRYGWGYLIALSPLVAIGADRAVERVQHHMLLARRRSIGQGTTST